MKSTLLYVLFTCLFAFPAMVNAQSINRTDLLDKTWYFVAMKCPDKVSANNDGHYIHYFSTLKMKASNVNNINYGTYERINKDLSDNPKETGSYSLTTDEVGNVILTLKKARTGAIMRYIVSFVETNHLTLIRLDEGDKCNVSFAIAP